MGIAIPQVITSDRASGAQVIDGSLKFDDDSSNVLKRTPGSAGNRKTWTWSGWFKRTKLGTVQGLFSAITTPGSNSNRFTAFINTNDLLYIIEDISGATNYWAVPTQVFRDVSAWYHLVFAFDTTISTPTSDRVKVYVNGDEVTSFTLKETITENRDTFVNSTLTHYIGLENSLDYPSKYWDGQMSQVYLIDGQALDPSYFGFTDPLTNTWKPKKAEIPGFNDGTVWSSNSTNFTNPGQGFNGNPSNYAEVSSTAAKGTFTFPKSIQVENNVTFIYSSGTSGNLFINDSSTAMQGTSLQIQTISFTGTLSSISLQSASQPVLYYFSVDGKPLIDSVTNNFGNNGFYLPMDGNSPIGQDKSGNGNDWTPVNFGGSVALDNPQVSGARPIMNTTQGGTQAGVGVFGSKENKYYTVTTANGSVYQFDITSGDNPSLSFIRGATYKFDYSSFTGHPVLFSSTNPDSSTTAYTDGTSTASNVISFTVPHNAPDTLYYYCQNHPTSMNGSISVTTDETKADPYAWKNTLALPLVGSADDVSNQINSGSTTKVVTVDGAVASSAFSNFYGGSFEFDGTDDDLTIPDSADFNFGADDFTMEMWVYSDASQTKEIMGQRGAGVEGAFSIYHVGANILLYVGSNGSSWDIVAGDTIATNVVGQWTHIAIVRNGNNFLTFQNGVHVSTTVDSGTVQDSSSPLSIGSNAGTFFFDGKLSDIRIYKGVAKYTSDFVVPATSPDILPDTPSGVSGSSKLTKITDGAVSFDGSGDYLSLESSSDLEMGTGDFTIEMYVFSTDSSTDTQDRRFFATEANATSSIQVGHINTTAGIVEYADQGNLNVRVTGTTNILNRWAHVAVVRNSGTVSLYIDGKSEGTPATDSNSKTASTPTIGKYPGASGHFKGFLSNIRVLKGTALYTSNFTPPTAPLTNVTNTKLLCCQSNTSAIAADVSPDGGYAGSGGITLSSASLDSGAASLANIVDGNLSTSANIRGDGSFVQMVFPQQQNGELQVYAANGNDNLDDNIRVFIDGVEGTSFDISGSTPSPAWHTIHTGNFTTVKLEHQGSTTGYIYGFRIGTSGDTITNSITANGDAAATNFNPFTTDINTVRGQESGYCTLNPLTNYIESGTYTLPVISDGNLTVKASTTRFSGVCGDIFATSGKFYAEVTKVSGQTTDDSIGFGARTFQPSLDGNVYIGRTSDSYGFYGSGGSGGAGRKIHNNSFSDYGSSWGALGDVMGLLMDLDNGTLSLAINNINQGVAYSSIDASLGWTFTVAPYNNQEYSLNFGQKPFKFLPPDGFQPLNAANVRPETVISRPDQYVGITTYTGTNASIRTIPTEFEADLVWIKSRNLTRNNVLYDTVRGATKKLFSNATNAEQTDTNGVKAFLENGVTIGNAAEVGSEQGYVMWHWKAGGNKNTFNIDDVGYASAAAAGLTAGTITPTGASVNTKSGFSIIKWDGSGSSGTLSHGLGRTPGFILLKGTSAGEDGQNWRTYHSVLGTSPSNTLFINLTNASQSNTERISAVGADTFTLSSGGAGVNVSGQSYITYIWAEIPGFSKFGSYTGNGNADGPFVELGFRPSLIWIKCADSAQNWVVNDTERKKFNPSDKVIYINSNFLEATSSSRQIDILSNGFKIRGADTDVNTIGDDYLYCAWAEAPSVNLYGGGANAR